MGHNTKQRLIAYNLIDKYFLKDFPNQDFIFLSNQELEDFLKARDWYWTGSGYYNAITKKKFITSSKEN